MEYIFSKVNQNDDSTIWFILKSESAKYTQEAGFEKVRMITHKRDTEF